MGILLLVRQRLYIEMAPEACYIFRIAINSLRPSDAYMHQYTIIGSDNGLSLGRRQAIIWTNAGIYLIRTLEKNSIKS